MNHDKHLIEMKAEEQAKKILWALMEAVRIGEPMSVERKIIENGLLEYTQQSTLSHDKVMEVLSIAMGELLHNSNVIPDSWFDITANKIRNLSVVGVKEELARMTEDRDCAVQSFQDTLAELNKLEDKPESVGVSEEEILKMYDIRDDEIAQARYYTNIAEKKILEDGNQSWPMIAGYAVEIALNHFAGEIEEWLQSLQSKEQGETIYHKFRCNKCGFEFTSDDLAHTYYTCTEPFPQRTSGICGGEIELAPPTPEKGGES